MRVSYEQDLRQLFSQRRKSPFNTVDENDPRRWLSPLGDTHPMPAPVNPVLPRPTVTPESVGDLGRAVPGPATGLLPPMQRVRIGQEAGRDASPYEDLAAQERVLSTAAPSSRIHRTDWGYEVAPPEQSPSRLRGSLGALQRAQGRSEDLGPWGKLAALVSGGITGAIRPGQSMQLGRDEELASVRQRQAGMQKQALEQQKVAAGIDADKALAEQRREGRKPTFFEGQIGENEYGLDPTTEVRWRQKPDGSSEIVLVGQNGQQRPIVMKSADKKSKGLLAGAHTASDAQGNKFYVDESGKPIADPQNPAQPLYADRIPPKEAKPDVSGDLSTEISQLQAQIDADQKAYNEHDLNIRNKEAVWKKQAAAAYQKKSITDSRSLDDFYKLAQAEDKDFIGEGNQGSAYSAYNYSLNTRDEIKERLAENRTKIKELQSELRSAKKSGNTSRATTHAFSIGAYIQRNKGATEADARAFAASNYPGYQVVP